MDPVLGCEGCKTTGGAFSCPTHGHNHSLHPGPYPRLHEACEAEIAALRRRVEALEGVVEAARELCTTLTIGDGLTLTEPHHPSILKNYRMQVHADRTKLGEAVAKARALAPAEGEDYEEWHRRECPWMHIPHAEPYGACDGSHRWTLHGERFVHFDKRTCREVWESERPAPGAEEGA